MCSIGRCLHLTASQHPLEKGLEWEDDLLQLLKEQIERERERELQEMEGEKEREKSTALITLQATRSSISAATIREEDSGGEVCYSAVY